MKVLCIYSNCAPDYIRSGWGNAFITSGHEFRFWDISRQPAFDVFDEYEPDLFIGTTYDLDRATFKCIQSRVEMKVILFGSCWGDLINEIDLKKYPIVVAQDNEKKMIEKLKNETGKPNLVFIHYHDNWIEPTMGLWNSIGVKPIGVMNAADTVIYNQGSCDENLKCDIGFTGGYWQYKARNLNPYMMPLCHDNNLNVKIFGNQKWPVSQYLGTIDSARVNDLFCSSTVSPNVSEPHSTRWGFDIIERPFKILSSGGFCVSDYVESMQNDVFTENEIPCGKTAKEFVELVKYYVNNPEERKKFMEKGRKLVLTQHTYYDRMGKVLRELNLDSEAMKMETIKNNYFIKNK